MPLSVKRLPRAYADRLEIWLHIATDNITAADQITDRMDVAIGRLSEYPELGPERPGLGNSIRVFPVENFVIFYRLKPGIVEIVRILHADRDITPDLLTD